MLNQSQLDDLESIIDSSDLQQVLDALATIAHEKASHLETNWQDRVAAKSWTRDAIKIQRLAAKLEN